ncbi:MAG: hypothetical protein ACYCOY_02105 [Metallibacterium sp.]
MNAQIQTMSVPTVDDLKPALAERAALQAKAQELEGRRAKLRPFEAQLQAARDAYAGIEANDAESMRKWFDAGNKGPAPKPSDRAAALAEIETAAAQLAAATAADTGLHADQLKLAEEAQRVQQQIATLQGGMLAEAYSDVLREHRAGLLAEIERDTLAGLLAGRLRDVSPAHSGGMTTSYAQLIRAPFSDGERKEAQRKGHARFHEICEAVSL